MNLIIVLLIGGLFGLVVMGGLIVLQVNLCQNEKGVFGMILPGLSFFIALVMTMLLAFLVPAGSDVMMGATRSSVGFGFGSVIITFLLMNAPTFVYLAIYFVIRVSRKRK